MINGNETFDVSDEQVRAECFMLIGEHVGRGLMNPAVDIAQAQAYAAFVLELIPEERRRLRLDLLRATRGGMDEAPDVRIERARAYEAFILEGPAPPEGS